MLKNFPNTQVQPEIFKVTLSPKLNALTPQPQGKGLVKIVCPLIEQGPQQLGVRGKIWLIYPNRGLAAGFCDQLDWFQDSRQYWFHSTKKEYKMWIGKDSVQKEMKTNLHHHHQSNRISNCVMFWGGNIAPKRQYHSLRHKRISTLIGATEACEGPMMDLVLLIWSGGKRCHDIDWKSLSEEKFDLIKLGLFQLEERLLSGWSADLLGPCTIWSSLRYLGPGEGGGGALRWLCLGVGWPLTVFIGLVLSLNQN